MWDWAIPSKELSMKKLFPTVEWARITNIYEVNVRQYTPEGTLNAFAKELPRLKAMGVGTLWFMPVTPISVKNRKGTLGSYYSCSDYTAINPEFGTLKDFKALVKKAHKLGLKVMMDWVANHTGWDHVWTKTNPEFFTRDATGQFLPPFPDWEDVIHLNYSNPKLREEMIRAMKFWVKECDLDGFRCDMAHLVPLDFWREARAELDAMKPLFWLAEAEEPHYHEVFDASYAWEFLHTMEKYWRGEVGIRALDTVLYGYEERFPREAIRLYFTSNHDENSHSGTEYERMGDAAKVFAVLCATWNGVPLIYSGQELPMTDKRLQFFDKDLIPWNGRYELEDFYRALFMLRANNPALSAGDPLVRTFRLETTRNDVIFGYLLKREEREVLVLLNLSKEDQLQFDIVGSVASGTYINAFSGISRDLDMEKSFVLDKWDFLVFEK